MDRLYRLMWERTAATTPPLPSHRLATRADDTPPPRHVNGKCACPLRWTNACGLCRTTRMVFRRLMLFNFCVICCCAAVRKNQTRMVSIRNRGNHDHLDLPATVSRSTDIRARTAYGDVPSKRQKHFLPGRVPAAVESGMDKGYASTRNTVPTVQSTPLLSYPDLVHWQWTAAKPPQPCPSRAPEAQPPASKLQVPGGPPQGVESVSAVLDTSVSACTLYRCSNSNGGACCRYLPLRVKGLESRCPLCKPIIRPYSY